MEKENLMIGDWVKFPAFIDKVVEISFVEGLGYCASFAASATLFPVKLDEIKPVRMTDEIIEKNGWEKIENWDDVIYYPGISKQWVHKDFTDTLRISYNENIHSYFILNNELRFINVHEFQHILKAIDMPYIDIIV